MNLHLLPSRNTVSFSHLESSWPCDLLRLVECHRSKRVPSLSLGLKKPFMLPLSLLDLCLQPEHTLRLGCWRMRNHMEESQEVQSYLSSYGSMQPCEGVQKKPAYIAHLMCSIMNQISGCLKPFNFKVISYATIAIETARKAIKILN